MCICERASIHYARFGECTLYLGGGGAGFEITIWTVNLLFNLS